MNIFLYQAYIAPRPKLFREKNINYDKFYLGKPSISCKCIVFFPYNRFCMSFILISMVAP